MTHKSMKRFLAMLLCAMMALGCVNTAALAEETEAAPCAHANTAVREEAGAAAGCASEGYHTVITVCADCGAELSRQTVTDGALGHAWQESARTEASCGAAGAVIYACSRCGESRSEEIPALGHDYQETARTEATYDADGSVTYTCSRCGDSYAQALPKLERPADEPTQDESPQEEPPQDEPPQDEPTQDEPPQDNPQQDEPPQDNPQQDEPPQDNPQQDQPPQVDPQQEQPAVEAPAQAFEQTEIVENIKITVKAEAGVFAPDARLTIDKVKSKETIADFKMAAEAKLGIQSSGTVKIRHLIYSISGAEMTGEAQAKVERLKLGDILAEYPGAEIKVFVLRYKAEEQQLADRAVKLKANLNLEGSSVRFALSKLGLYDVVTVVTLPSQPAAPANETQDQPQANQPQDNQPTIDQPQADQPQDNQPTADQPQADQPANEQSQDNQPADD